MIDGATHVTVDGVTVHGLDMEGVHFRNSSTYGVIRNSRIYDTGNDGRGSNTMTGGKALTNPGIPVT